MVASFPEPRAWTEASGVVPSGTSPAGTREARRSVATAADEACTYGAQVAARDRLFLDGAERVAEVPAVEPGAAERRTELEVRLECGGGPLGRGRGVAVGGGEVVGRLRPVFSECPPPSAPPRRGLRGEGPR